MGVVGRQKKTHLVRGSLLLLLLLQLRLLHCRSHDDDRGVPFFSRKVVFYSQSFFEQGVCSFTRSAHGSHKRQSPTSVVSGRWAQRMQMSSGTIRKTLIFDSIALGPQGKGNLPQQKFVHPRQTKAP